MSSSFTFERESILRPSIDCLFKAREKEEQKKMQTGSSSNCGKIVKLCLLSCVSHSSTHKQNTHTPTQTHMLLSIASHTHTRDNIENSFGHWAASKKQFAKWKKKNSIDVDFPHVVIPLTLYSFPASDSLPSPLPLAHLTVVMKLPTLLQ